MKSLARTIYKNNIKFNQLNNKIFRTFQTQSNRQVSNQLKNLFNKQKYLFASADVAAQGKDKQNLEQGNAVSEQEFTTDVNQILNLEDQKLFRNVAIVAHVDHGKTTLVDTLLQHCGCVLNHERSMDGNELEKEKGITILSKCTTITYQGHKINLVDTPGHCDFGGEVERIMGMVDSVILLVCATEGPMPQTRYVLQKAIKSGLKPIVVVNKVDRPSARPEEVVNEVFDLFCDLEIDDELLDYPIFFCSGRDGWAVQNLEDLDKDDQHKDINVILKAILDHVPAPQNKAEGDTQILVSQTESNKYFGKMVIGRIEKGVIELNDKLTSIDSDGSLVQNGKVQKIIKKYGMQQIEMKRAVAGDIVSIAGFSQSTVTHTLNTQGKKEVIPSIPIDPPIMSISINVNTSPIAGKEGKKMSKNAIKTRLIEESDNDVALKLEGVGEGIQDSSDIVVKGRGDLHLGILIEKMRREGFEMNITPPIILFKEDADGTLLEPMEKIMIECDPVYVPSIIEKLGNRGAIYESSEEISRDLHKVEFIAPTRGMIGFRTVLLNDTKGTANIETQLVGYEPHKGPLNRNNKGALISTATGQTSAYAIKGMEQFGQMFIRPNQKVYQGMVIGESQKEGDMELNPTKLKQLTNIRTHATDEKILLQPHRQFTVEEAVSYIREDEMVEVTPQEIRIRKRVLDPGLRKKFEREAQGGGKKKKR